MDEEYNNDGSYNQGDDSNNQPKRRSSFMSLDRMSGISREPSLRNRPTLVQVLSIEGSEMGGDDIFEYYEFQANNRKSIFRNSGSSRMGSGNQNSMDIQESRDQRRSSNANKGPRHQCRCDDGHCLQYHCICSSEPNQMCWMGFCCINCIQMKNKMMADAKIQTRGCLCKNTKCLKSYCKCHQSQQKCDPNYCKCSGCQNMAVQTQPKNPAQKKNINKPKPVPSKNSKNAIFCSCKKSHCLKKYCICYSSGKECGPHCICEDCFNQYEQGQDREEKDDERQRYAKVEDDDEDIDQYFEEKDYDELEMPASMQFEHPDMKLSFQQ